MRKGAARVFILAAELLNPLVTPPAHVKINSALARPLGLPNTHGEVMTSPPVLHPSTSTRHTTITSLQRLGSRAYLCSPEHAGPSSPSGHRQEYYSSPRAHSSRYCRPADRNDDGIRVTAGSPRATAPNYEWHCDDPHAGAAPGGTPGGHFGGAGRSDRHRQYPASRRPWAPTASTGDSGAPDSPNPAQSGIPISDGQLEKIKAGLTSAAELLLAGHNGPGTILDGVTYLEESDLKVLDLKLGACNSYTIEEQNSDVIEI